jgi:hypothetical protein
MFCEIHVDVEPRKDENFIYSRLLFQNFPRFNMCFIVRTNNSEWWILIILFTLRQNDASAFH